MATLFTQRQHKISHFFVATTENDGGAEKKKPKIAEVVPIANNNKTQSSLNTYFVKKK